MKRIIAIFLILTSVLSVNVKAEGMDIKPFELEAKSAVLMEAETGRVLYSKNANTPLPPASVTKVMTLLLIMEHIDGKKMSLSDSVTVSEYAASMGGSQVFLESGETMSVEDLLKSIIIASANDAAVAMAEAVAGTEEAFVKRMNERAKELGMKNTNFENVTGLDDDTANHTISAMDIAIASRELICNHERILEYSGIWMDSIRNGEFGLTNTNRLIRFYKGATGLKTGSTDKAGFCISATAKREGMHLIAVIMGSETRDIRNNAAKALLDWGFANYSLYKDEGRAGEVIEIKKGNKDSIRTEIQGFETLVEKNTAESIEIKVRYEEKISAPVKKGDKVGKAEYYCKDKKIGECDIVSKDTVYELSFINLFFRMLKGLILKE